MTPEKINIVISPEVLSSDIVQEIYGSNAFGVFSSSWCVCLLLQDLLQSCSRGGEEESGRHVL